MSSVHARPAADSDKNGTIATTSPRTAVTHCCHIRFFCLSGTNVDLREQVCQACAVFVMNSSILLCYTQKRYIIRSTITTMNRVVHFEIQADDLDRAQKFYEAAFGWTFQHMGEEYGNYRVISTGKNMEEMLKGGLSPHDLGINGGLMKRNGPRPAEGSSPNAFTCIVGVQNIDESMAKIEAAGGKPHTDKMDVPNVGKIRYYADTEGNIFGIIEPAPMP